MRFTVELAESELGDLRVDGAAVRLRLAAAAARNDEDERGWLASVLLEFSGAMVHGDTTSAFGRIARGALRHGTAQVPRLPAPGRLDGDLELALELANGTRLVVHGHALALSVAADARFAEDWSC